MFKGEFRGLKALQEAGMRVPEPLLVGRNYIVMEFCDIKGLDRFSEALGELLAKLHLGGSGDGGRVGGENKAVEEFGFETTTCCGFLPLDNTWNKDWINFYTTQRLAPQIERIQTKYGDRQIGELWSQLKLVLPSFFTDIVVKPSLLHGDLWSGNAAQIQDGPVVYDPASFYGHDEFDLAITRMFGGFRTAFYDSYHRLLPRRPGFQKRADLYLLFHQLNHWSHFGGSYKDSSLNTMRKLVNS